MARTTRTAGPTWRQRKDPLWCGDGKDGLEPVDPGADPSLVRHILYLGGHGRATPYHSTSEEHAAAGHFAGTHGRVYSTTVPRTQAKGIAHISRVELLRLLKGKGQGLAKWSSALEVMQARKYVEQWCEHILSYADFTDSDSANSAAEDVFD
jgi:hypothetical protein